MAHHPDPPPDNHPPFQVDHVIGDLRIRTGIDGDRVVTLRRAGQQVDIPPAEWATLRQMILDGAL